MAATQGIVRVQRTGTAVTFRVEGRATMLQSVPFRRCGQQCLGGGVQSLRVDLRDCTWMDSTFIGTLLSLRALAVGRSPEAFVLVSPSEACNKLLAQMGLQDLFLTMNAEAPPEADWEELTGDLSDPRFCKRHIAQCHRELAKLPGATGQMFQGVVDSLAGDPDLDESP